MAGYNDRMAHMTLDARVAALEKEVQRLVNRPADQAARPAKDWRAAAGMLTHDPVIDEVIEAGRAIREHDRERGRA